MTQDITQEKGLLLRGITAVVKEQFPGLDYHNRGRIEVCFFHLLEEPNEHRILLTTIGRRQERLEEAQREERMAGAAYEKATKDEAFGLYRS